MRKGQWRVQGLAPGRMASCKPSPGQGRLSLGQMAALATSKRVLLGPGGEQVSPSAFQPSARPITEILPEILGQDITSRKGHSSQSLTSLFQLVRNKMAAFTLKNCSVRILIKCTAAERRTQEAKPSLKQHETSRSGRRG